jgi:leader peptidase (prepilin peptidase) / N-methyltransferase
MIPQTGPPASQQLRPGLLVPELRLPIRKSFSPHGKTALHPLILPSSGPDKGKAAAMLWGLTLALTLVLVVIAEIDARTRRIPDLLSLPLIGAGLIAAYRLPLLPIQHHLIGAGVGFALFALVGELYFRRTGTDGLGLGDAKLFAAAGAWLGWQGLPMVLLIAALGGLAFAVVRGRTDRRAALAFGPWLALGFWAVWVWQNLSFHVSV